MESLTAGNTQGVLEFPPKAAGLRFYESRQHKPPHLNSPQGNGVLGRTLKDTVANRRARGSSWYLGGQSRKLMQRQERQGISGQSPSFSRVTSERSLQFSGLYVLAGAHAAFVIVMGIL